MAMQIENMQSVARVRRRQGRCLELAWKVIAWESGGKRWFLIHGGIAQHPLSENIIGHAWIELDDGRVYDPVLDKFMTKDAYMIHRRAVIERCYSLDEALRLVVEARHYGPWHQREMRFDEEG
jgi:hypothetical protein